MNMKFTVSIGFNVQIHTHTHTHTHNSQMYICRFLKTFSTLYQPCLITHAVNSNHPANLTRIYCVSLSGGHTHTHTHTHTHGAHLGRGHTHTHTHGAHLGRGHTHTYTHTHIHTHTHTGITQNIMKCQWQYLYLLYLSIFYLVAK